jgi:uncharacterized protein (TIGR00299 family) protein
MRRAATERRSILYVDCFAGLAGDMLLGALMDLNQPTMEAISHALVDGLPDLGFRLKGDLVHRQGIGARQVRVIIDDEASQPSRHWRDIRQLLEEADLPQGTLRRAVEIFERLAQAEGRVHRRAPEEVHFHEVGAVDSIVDIVGVAAGLDFLDAEIHCAPLPLGRGFVQCQHGTLPLPAPATLEVLAGVPVYGTELESELVTPTGAAIVSSQTDQFGPLPPMTPITTGWGAGTRELADRPSLVRLVLGHKPAPPVDSACVVMEANIDDMTSEVAAHALEQAMSQGALDAWVTPITMKKGRPAFTLSLLVRHEDQDSLAALLLRETTTIGLRLFPVSRRVLPRETQTVDTEYGPVPVKLAYNDGRPCNIAPEFEACRRLARAQEVPLKHVMAAAVAAAWSLT